MAAVSDGGTIRIEGLRDFYKALKRVSAEYPETLRKANYDLAKAVVVKSKERAKDEPGVARKAAKSLRASRAVDSATVSGGGARYPYFYGAEFGALKYRQFQTWRGNQWGGWEGGPGYFLHPTIRDHAAELISEYFDKLDDLHKQAFPE